MKKYLFSVISCVLIGSIMGKIIFNQYSKNESETKTVSSVSENAYFFQYGVYSTKENMKNAMANFSSYIYIKDNDKYYVFLAITKDENNKEKLKKYFESLSYNIYIKELDINNGAFIDTLNQYDLLLKEANDSNEIKKIMDTVLEEYERLINNG